MSEIFGPHHLAPAVLHPPITLLNVKPIVPALSAPRLHFWTPYGILCDKFRTAPIINNCHLNHQCLVSINSVCHFPSHQSALIVYHCPSLCALFSISGHHPGLLCDKIRIYFTLRPKSFSFLITIHHASPNLSLCLRTAYRME